MFLSIQQNRGWIKLAKKTKLRCFTCTQPFKSKEEIFRGEKNYPICQDCLIESLEDFWVDDFAEHIFDEIKNKFGKKYTKWYKWFHKNHTKCDGEHNNYDLYYEENDCITEINGKNYCRDCIDNMKSENIENIIEG